MLLAEKYRPKTFEDFIGNERVIAQVKELIEDPSFDRGAFWIEGASGIGKTSLAYVIANHFKAEILDVNGRRCNADFVQGMEADLRPSPLFGAYKWKAIIINESHAMTRPAVQELLTVLENLPPKCLVIFTTTEDIWKSPQDEKATRSKKDGLFGEFTKPFVRRIFHYRLSNQGLVEAFAQRAKTIAQAEGKDGLPIEAYVKAVKDSGNCLGEVLKQVQQGTIG
ncbi:MAG: AAA family ATPase [Planctomycetota bacterium]